MRLMILKDDFEACFVIRMCIDRDFNFNLSINKVNDTNCKDLRKLERIQLFLSILMNKLEKSCQIILDKNEILSSIIFSIVVVLYF